MLPCLDSSIRQSDFAALVGVSEAVVSDLRSRGVIKPGDTARIWLRSYIDQLRTAASGRSDATGELTLARIRESNAKAAKAEIEASKELGLLVDATAVELAFREWIARGVQAIDSAEKRITDMIGSEFGIALEDRHVREHLRTARRDLAEYRGDLMRRLGPGGDGLDTQRTGTDG